VERVVIYNDDECVGDMGYNGFAVILADNFPVRPPLVMSHSFS
jgi:hypothetical protein